MWAHTSSREKEINELTAKQAEIETPLREQQEQHKQIENYLQLEMEKWLEQEMQKYLKRL